MKTKKKSKVGSKQAPPSEPDYGWPGYDFNQLLDKARANVDRLYATHRERRSTVGSVARRRRQYLDARKAHHNCS